MTARDRWLELVHRAATGTKKTRTLLTPLGLLIFGVFTGLFVAAALLLDRILVLPGLLPASAVLPVGIPVTVLGAAITAWSATHFLKVKGTPVPFNPPPRLVTSGPYCLARNPMLAGVFILLLGIGLLIDSTSQVLIFTPLYVLANIWELKRIEEPELLRRFGAEYQNYAQLTPMFLPGLAGLKRLVAKERGN